MKPRVLVATTSRWVPTARLAMALANAGCTVEAVCPTRHPLGKTSAVRQMHTYHGLAPLMSFTDAIVASNPDLIVPGDDLATRHLHDLYRKGQGEGNTGALICALIERSLGAAESFPVVFARSTFMELAHQEGIRVPKTGVVKNTDDLRRQVERLGFPMVLKANGTSGGDGVRFVRTLEEAERTLRALQAPPLVARAAKRALVDQDTTLLWPSLLRRRFVVNAQAFVTGREATSTIFCWKGAVLAGLHFEVLNKMEPAGPSTVVRLIEHTEMSAAVEKIARRLNLSGLHGLDFILEAHTENAYLIEINPRATQVGHLTLGPGRDLPAALHAAVSGAVVQEAPKVTENSTITLFPHEWLRNPASPFLRSSYHDVPWEEPGLVRVCLCGSSKRGIGFRQQDWAHARSAMHQSSAITVSPKDGSFGLRSRANAGLTSEYSAGQSQKPAQQVYVLGQTKRSMRKSLQITKFGGTSVGDASCIRKVLEIIRAASRETEIVVVVSAMAGVTNKLIDAAMLSVEGNRDAVTTIFEELRKQHNIAASALLDSSGELSRKIDELLQEGDRLCQGIAGLHQLTPRASDSVSSLGERLSAPLVAAALAELGVASEAIDATELITTDSRHGAADPLMDLTRQRCQARLRPLLQQGIVPIVTGFIGSTAEGVLTTLGRGGSDYSATILGAALDADKVIIWTDVDGLMTADPRLVPDARTIAEISYREAAELAYFGARVLHPKTLRPVMQSGIPLQIRNTFAPERAGTKITPAGSANNGRVTAIAAISDASLITVHGRDVVDVKQILGHTFSRPSPIGGEILLISHSSAHNETCLVVHSSVAKAVAEALRCQFEQDVAHQKVEQIKVESTVALVTAVSPQMATASELIDRVFGALAREDVSVRPIVQASSACNLSYLVARRDLKAALLTTHREFQLGELDSQPLAVSSDTDTPVNWLCGSERATADAD